MATCGSAGGVPHQSGKLTITLTSAPVSYLSVKVPPPEPSEVVPKKCSLVNCFWSDGSSVSVCPRNSARFALVPDVSGIRSGTSSTLSLSGVPTLPDNGISSAGSEYGVGLPLIWLNWRVSERVMPTVVNRLAVRTRT